MTSRREFRRSVLLAGALALAAFSASPARADRCDDVAKQLAGQVDGVKVNFKAANIVYLTHPAAKELSIGCRGKSYSLELYAKTDRKFKPEFLDLVARAGALVFTIPKPDVVTGSTRCMKRMGILRGDKVSMRFRRLNMECTRTKKKRRSRSPAARTSSGVRRNPLHFMETTSPLFTIGRDRRPGFTHHSFQWLQCRRQ